jgi:hypothetical protein
MVRELIWCFYKTLKAWKERPSPAYGSSVPETL